MIQIDWPNALVGAMVGWLLGFGCDRMMLWSRRVRMRVIRFERVRVNSAVLYKLRFALDGQDSPGECSCELESNGQTTWAKWDEKPNPLVGDRLDGFDAGLVPNTVFQTLVVKREYSLPILAERGGVLDLFGGWWFGKNMGYYRLSPVDSAGSVTIALRGAGLNWKRKFPVQEIIQE